MMAGAFIFKLENVDLLMPGLDDVYDLMPGLDDVYDLEMNDTEREPSMADE